MFHRSCFPFVLFCSLTLLLTGCRPDGTQIPGLQEEVQVYRDSSGINHIYAQNEPDLFFAQGYLAARDRLFQFETAFFEVPDLLFESGPSSADL